MMGMVNLSGVISLPDNIPVPTQLLEPSVTFARTSSQDVTVLSLTAELNFGFVSAIGIAIRVPQGA